MANYFVNMPRPQASNAVDFSPVNNAFANIAETNRYNALVERQNEQQQYQRGRDAKQDARTAQADSRVQAEMWGKRASAIDQLQGPQRAAAWQKVLATLPDDGTRTPEELDPMTGPKMMMAEAGLFRDPREDQLADLKLQGAQLDNRLTQARIGKINSNEAQTSEFQQREAQLRQFGIDPASPEGQMYLFNKKLPSKLYDNEAQLDKRVAAAPKIAAGLHNLAGMASIYDDASFENAVGPIQGSSPDGIVSGAMVGAARLFGEAANAVQGGGSAPSEVRSNIQGSTEALAAAIKPLIRGPGEGVWSDADQARLVSIVGDLAQARNKDEFLRRLDDVAARVTSNFDLPINFQATPKAQGRLPQNGAPQPGAVMDGYIFKGGDPADKNNWERQ